MLLRLLDVYDARDGRHTSAFGRNSTKSSENGPLKTGFLTGGGGGGYVRRVRRHGSVFRARPTDRHHCVHACAASARACLERAARSRARAPSSGRLRLGFGRARRASATAARRCRLRAHGCCGPVYARVVACIDLKCIRHVQREKLPHHASVTYAGSAVRTASPVRPKPCSQTCSPGREHTGASWKPSRILAPRGTPRACPLPLPQTACMTSRTPACTRASSGQTSGRAQAAGFRTTSRRCHAGSSRRCRCTGESPASPSPTNTRCLCQRTPGAPL